MGKVVRLRRLSVDSMPVDCSLDACRSTILGVSTILDCILSKFCSVCWVVKPHWLKETGNWKANFLFVCIFSDVFSAHHCRQLPEIPYQKERN